MNKFEKQLEKWNNGVLRGAQAKLARALGVSTATTALWSTGKRRPSKGYVAQMAALFGLDVYSVLKLFEIHPSIIYPTPAETNSVHLLRDAAEDYSYQAVENVPQPDPFLPQSNSVLLPFLNTIPPQYPQYDTDNVLEWWSIPRRYAQGAKYIIRSRDAALDNAAGDDDLCLVNPGADPSHGQAVLFTNGKGRFAVYRAQTGPEGLSYSTLSGKAVKVGKSFYPLGIVVRRIQSL